ncbi:MAG: biopolymer transporter ExbD [Myxococcales bacterium]|nr:biopolymer transporter ExbD [Myxococcota bacterium]MDW8281584.1 biopolymer transporter ExbD [Myxococcales bacterium]
MAAGTPHSYTDEEAGSGMIADINVTPLVDITLVLLIIMMVAAPVIANNPSIKVELPKAATGDETPKSTLSFTLARPEGGGGGFVLYLNGERVDEEKARAVVRDVVAKHREVQAVIAADRGIAYGDVMHIVDVVKALGVHKFAMATDGT